MHLNNTEIRNEKILIFPNGLTARYLACYNDHQSFVYLEDPANFCQ